jgi:L-fuconolactonase
MSRMSLARASSPNRLSVLAWRYRSGIGMKRSNFCSHIARECHLGQLTALHPLGLIRTGARLMLRPANVSAACLTSDVLGPWCTPMLSGEAEKTNGGAAMPYGGNDWLALTQETTLESEIPICDPHHHFWDFRSERIPYQRYLLHELAADVNCGHNVRSTVFIEARSMYRPDGPVELRPVGEVEFVQGLAAAAATGLYGPCRAASAIIGHADLKLGDRVAPVLEALQAASPNRFRGIRHTVTWDPHPEIENREKEGVLATADYRAGARALARMGLSLDIGVCFPQLPELASFAKALPDLTIILNHLGGLTRVGPYADRDEEVLATWRGGLAAVAQCPNVNLKLGGIGMPRVGFDWHARARPIGSEELASSMASIMSYCIEQFGPNRCMFESNFPVDKVSFSHHVLFNAFKRFSKSYSASERAALFHDTAARAYRISDIG